MRQVAKALAKQGRGPDTELVHMTKGEVKALANIAGVRSLPVNPKTGLHEAGLLSTILPMAAMAFAPELGLATLGGSATLGMGAAGALGGGLGSMLEGRGLSGAIGGGLTGALGGALGYAGGNPLGAELAPRATTAAEAAIQNAATPALQQAAVPWDMMSTGVTQAPLSGYDLAMQQAATPALQQAATPALQQMAQAPIPTGLTDSKWASMDWTKPTYPTYQTAYDSLATQYAGNPAYTPQVLDKMATAAVKASTPGTVGQMVDLAAANPKTALGIGALGAYGLNQAMNPKTVTAPKQSVYMAGPSSSAIAQTGAVGTPGGPEVNYFTPNALTSYTQAPGAWKTYADGGAVQSGIMGFARGGELNLRPHSKSLTPMFTRGAGDGMSDDIPAYIDGDGQRANEPIRVADGEYIVPADAVAHIGNGSSNAGAKKLDGMVSKVRTARTGKAKQAPAVKAERYMPA